MLLVFSFRVYTEKYNEEQLMLYIDNIQTSDVGNYTCRGDLKGRTVEKSVSLTIYSPGLRIVNKLLFVIENSTFFFH